MLPELESFDAMVENNTTFTGELLRYLKQKHNVAPEDDRAIRIWNPIQEAKRYFALTGGIKMFFWGVGFFTIIAGVVSVSNIMLIVVKERTREIGIRKALGANSKSIVKQFLIEALTICLLGGFFGILLGVIIGNLVSSSVGSGFIMPYLWITIGLMVCVFTGLIAGIYPAIKASRLDPIEALRTD